jgi:ATP-dependent Clp protease ATP-binding subunit ClpA
MIGTEQLLLGLLDERDGVAAQTLTALGVDEQEMRTTVLGAIGRGQQPGMDAIGLTPRAKLALELAVAEAKAMKHRHIGTEHLLLGLLREEEGIAAVLLAHQGVTLDRARTQVLQTLAAARRAKPGPKTNVVMCRVDDRALEALDLLIEAGIRTTRSDAAAWLIEAGIVAQSDLFTSVAATVAEIRRLRDVAQRLAQRATVPARLPLVPGDSATAEDAAPEALSAAEAPRPEQ